MPKMAWYKYAKYLTQNTNAQFDKTYKAGDTAPWSGIYRCDVCGHDCVSTAGNTLPPQGFAHTHQNLAQPITWRLVVASENA
jgi:hypothetical protein